MISFLIAMLIVLIIICVVAAIVQFILSNLPGMPAWAPRIVWAIAALAFLIWLLENVGRLGVHVP